MHILCVNSHILSLLCAACLTEVSILTDAQSLPETCTYIKPASLYNIRCIQTEGICPGLMRLRMAPWIHNVSLPCLPNGTYERSSDVAYADFFYTTPFNGKVEIRDLKTTQATLR